jgi:hypothetical protein
MRNQRTRVLGRHRRSRSHCSLFVALGGGAFASQALTALQARGRGMKAIEEGALEPFEEDRLLEALLARRPTRVTA